MKSFPDILCILAGGIITIWFFLMLSAFPRETEESEPVQSINVDVVALAVETPVPFPTATPTPTPEPDNPTYNLDIPLPVSIQQILLDSCDENGVDPAIVLGIIEVESHFDPNVDTWLCYGLMQLNRQYFPDCLSDAENIRHWVEYLGRLMERYNDVGAAITAYNAGHDTGDRRYANTVLKAAERWRGIIGH